MSWIFEKVIVYIITKVVDYLVQRIAMDAQKSKAQAEIDAAEAAKAKTALESRDKSDEEFDKASSGQLGRN